MDIIFQGLYRGEPLSRASSRTLFDAIAKGELEPILLAVALTALRIRGETPEEIAGASEALLANAEPFPRPDYDFADIVGTGGDGLDTFNVSTASAFVAAACGVRIAKHGNRGVSSTSGSSDLLAAFGIDLEMTASESRKALDELGICFLFAPRYHSGVRHAMEVRRAMKTRTIFNILGPLINPARPPLELLGVYEPGLVRPIAEALVALDLKRAIVVHGSGLDEVAIHGSTRVAEIRGGKIEEYTLTPADFGLDTYPLEAIRGGSPETNRTIVTEILQGRGTAAQESVVAANVALLLRLFGREDLKKNTLQAREAMTGGKPFQLVKALAG